MAYMCPMSPYGLMRTDGGRAAGGRRRGATRYYSIHKECIVSITRYSWASRYGPYCGNKNKYGTASPRRRPRTLPAKF